MKIAIANRDSVVVVAKVATAKAATVKAVAKDVERPAVKDVTRLVHKQHVRPNRVKRTIVPKVPTLNQPGLPVSHVNPSRARKPKPLRKQQVWLMHHAKQAAKKNVSRVVGVDAAIAARVMPVRKPQEKILNMGRLKRVQIMHLPRSRAPLKLLAHPRQRPRLFNRPSKLSSWTLRIRQTRNPRQPWQSHPPTRPICDRLKHRVWQPTRLSPASRAVRAVVVALRPGLKPRLSA